MAKMKAALPASKDKPQAATKAVNTGKLSAAAAARIRTKADRMLEG